MYIDNFPHADDFKTDKNEKIFEYLTNKQFYMEIDAICIEITNYYVAFRNDIAFLPYIMEKKCYNSNGNTLFYNRIIKFFTDRGFYITIIENEGCDLTMRVNISWF